MKTVCKNIAFSETGLCLLGTECICEANKRIIEESEAKEYFPDPGTEVSFLDIVEEKRKLQAQIVSITAERNDYREVLQWFQEYYGAMLNIEKFANEGITAIDAVLAKHTP